MLRKIFCLHPCIFKFRECPNNKSVMHTNTNVTSAQNSNGDEIPPTNFASAENSTGGEKLPTNSFSRSTHDVSHVDAQAVRNLFNDAAFSSPIREMESSITSPPIYQEEASTSTLGQGFCPSPIIPPVPPMRATYAQRDFESKVLSTLSKLSIAIATLTKEVCSLRKELAERSYYGASCPELARKTMSTSSDDVTAVVAYEGNRFSHVTPQKKVFKGKLTYFYNTVVTTLDFYFPNLHIFYMTSARSTTKCYPCGSEGENIKHVSYLGMEIDLSSIIMIPGYLERKFYSVKEISLPSNTFRILEEKLGVEL